MNLQLFLPIEGMTDTCIDGYESHTFEGLLTTFGFEIISIGKPIEDSLDDGFPRLLIYNCKYISKGLKYANKGLPVYVTFDFPECLGVNRDIIMRLVLMVAGIERGIAIGGSHRDDPWYEEGVRAGKKAIAQCPSPFREEMEL